MEVLPWINDNWFTLLQSAGIVGSLLLAAAALRLDEKTRRIGNLMAITKGHREIWSQLYERPELARVIDAEADLKQRKITREEELFIWFLILHLNSVYQALKNGVLLNLEGMHKDIGWFFSLPLPRMIWERAKFLQDADFVQFVEICRKEG
jgi:hypothetical protein